MITSPRSVLLVTGYCFVVGSFHPPSRHIKTSPTLFICIDFRGVVGTPCGHLVSSSNVTIFSRLANGCCVVVGIVCECNCCCCCWWCWCICWIGIIIVPVDRMCDKIGGGGERLVCVGCWDCCDNGIAISPTPKTDQRRPLIFF